MAKWIKVRDMPELKTLVDDPNKREDRKPPHWLRFRRGKYKDSYLAEVRTVEAVVRTTLKGEFRSWEDAKKAGEKLIAEAKYLDRTEEKPKVLCETIAQILIEQRKDNAPSTYEGAKIHFEKHIIPYLSRRCPFARDLSADTYRNYRKEKRELNPNIAIYNHWKHFVMLYRYAFENGYMPRKVTLKMEDRKKRSYSDEDEDEDHDEDAGRKRIIPREYFQMFLANACESWIDRATIQRQTGMRPGEVRRLKKNRVNFQTGVISLRARDTKTGESRSFVASPEVLSILRRRKLSGTGQYFFPGTVNPNRPMHKSYDSWHRAWEKAGINEGYTPHDLRHTYLTEMFKSGENPSLICYQAGLSLEEAQKTYLHFDAEDTRSIAAEAARRFS